MKFEKAKNLTALEVLELLQHMTRTNCLKMKQNNDRVQELNDAAHVKENLHRVNRFNKHTRMLISENNQYIELHTRLLCFLKSLNNKADLQIAKLFSDPLIKNAAECNTADFDDSFDRTVDGTLQYDEDHPFYSDATFRQKLLAFYLDREEYEKCAEIMDNSKGTDIAA